MVSTHEDLLFVSVELEELSPWAVRQRITVDGGARHLEVTPRRFWAPEPRYFSLEPWAPCMSEMEEDGDAELVDDEQSVAAEAAIVRTGQLVDFISGQLVRATPEEVDTVQVMARRLVEDFGYDKAQNPDRPQFRVRKFPADKRKTYPVDIAVFALAAKTEDHLKIVVECKRRPAPATAWPS